MLHQILSEVLLLIGGQVGIVLSGLMTVGPTPIMQQKREAHFMAIIKFRRICCTNEVFILGSSQYQIYHSRVGVQVDDASTPTRWKVPAHGHWCTTARGSC